MPPIANELLGRVDPTLAHELDALADLGARLDALVHAGREAWPDVPVKDGAWVEHLAKHLRSGEVERQLAELRAADVHLALACLSGHPRAHALLAARLRAVAGQALADVRLGAAAADELIGDVLAKLLVADERDARISTYSGRGPLDGWLRVTLARAALDRIRAGNREPSRSAEDDAALLADVASREDPHLSSLHARYAPVLKQAVEEALAALPASDRALLRLSIVEGLNIDELAAIYGAHRSTLARRLSRARAALSDEARSRATARLGVDGEEFQSLMGAMMSRLDITLRTILRNLPEER